MFAGGVGRIFTEFDGFLEAGSASVVKKKNKKLHNLLENFLDEISCLLNIDRADYEKGLLPWAFIFYNRMLSAQTLLSVEKYNKYLASFQEYLDTVSTNKKTVKKKQQYINNMRSLVDHLECHKVDPDSVLIGLNPSKTISGRFEDWIKTPCNHREEAKKLLNENKQRGETDPLALYLFDIPARCGDLVVVRLTPDQIKDKDLRNRAFIHSSVPAQSGVNVFGRIHDAVEFNKSTFITVFLAPKEETKVSIPASSVAPLRYLIPPGESWLGNVQLMRDMVADPYEEFLSFVKHTMIARLDEMLRPHSSVSVKHIHQALKQQPISFLNYHSLRTFAPIISTLSSQEQPTIDVTNSALPQTALPPRSEVMEKIRRDFIVAWENESRKELQKFMEEINEQDGTSNKLFMPTCEQDLMRLNKLNFKETAIEFLDNLSKSVQEAITKIDGERLELMKGTLKNQLSKWWLLLIKTRYELLLAQTTYDETAWCEDTYIDSPPRDIAGVRANLAVVQDLLNTNSELHQLIVEMTEDIKKEVYTVIDDFIMKAHVVLSSELMGVQISLDYSADDFELEDVRAVFEQKKENMKETLGEEIVLQYDGLMKDLKYLVEMKKLEYKTADDQKKKTVGGKLELSYAVPLSGLIMGCFFRLENILKTVLELWVPKEPKPVPIAATLPPTATPLSKSPSLGEVESSKPSNAANRPQKAKAKNVRPLSYAPGFRSGISQFGTISPSRSRNGGRRPTIIGATRNSFI